MMGIRLVDWDTMIYLIICEGSWGKWSVYSSPSTCSVTSNRKSSKVLSKLSEMQELFAFSYLPDCSILRLNWIICFFSFINTRELANNRVFGIYMLDKLYKQEKKFIKYIKTCLLMICHSFQTCWNLAWWFWVSSHLFWFIL